MDVRTTRKGIFSLIALSLFLLMAAALPVWAEGDGSGGGQNEPLGLVNSTPANGAKSVALDVKIKLTFNKNVINMIVKDNNLRCFSIYEGSMAVPVEVQMADDQIYPELKREVTLVPRQSLKAGTDYTIVISKALQAKSGAVLSQDVKIKFTTVAATAVKEPPTAGEEQTAAQAPKENGPQPESPTVLESEQKADDSFDAAKTEVKENPAENVAEKNSSEVPVKESAPDQTRKQDSKTGWIAILAVALLGGGYWLVRRKS